MLPTTKDRRVRRTQNLLKQSLIQLMYEKEFKDITIKDITELADLNRSTFYLHYEDIYDLLNQIENEAIQQFELILTGFNENKIEHSLTLLEQVFMYIDDNKKIFNLLLKQQKQAPQFLDKIKTLIQIDGLQTLQNVYSESSPESYTFFLSFVSSGILGVTMTWLNEELTLTPKELATLVDHMISSNSNLLTQKN